MDAELHAWRIDERECARQEQRRGRRHAFETLNPSRTALVVIDMVPFFMAGSSYCQGIVPNITPLAAALRAAGGTVEWVVPVAGNRAPLASASSWWPTPALPAAGKENPPVP